MQFNRPGQERVFLHVTMGDGRQLVAHPFPIHEDRRPEPGMVRKFDLGDQVVARLEDGEEITVYLFATGHGLPAFVNPFAKLGHFLALFKHPYWYKADSPFVFEALYLWQQIIPIVLIVLGLIGFHISHITLRLTQGTL